MIATSYHSKAPHSPAEDTMQMGTYQGLTLREWLFLGRVTGKIQNTHTAMLVSLMDENEAAAWVSDIVTGRISEAEAFVFMKRAIQNKYKYM
jgi:hypothetical protein